MKEQLFSVWLFGLLPEKRTKDDRIFESLALMNSHNLDRLFIALETKLNGSKGTTS